VVPICPAGRLPAAFWLLLGYAHSSRLTLMQSSNPFILAPRRFESLIFSSFARALFLRPSGQMLSLITCRASATNPLIARCRYENVAQRARRKGTWRVGPIEKQARSQRSIVPTMWDRDG